VRLVVALGLFALSLALYLSRLAPSVVPGDPGEYQIIAARWGIGHPPGYGFYAVASNLFTHLLPLGTFAWRANVFAAVCAAWMVALCYSIGRLVQDGLLSLTAEPAPADPGYAWPSLVYHVRQELPAILGASALATGIGLWQHAIHANAHILTALLATLTLYGLVRWWYDNRRAPGDARAGSNRWLYVAAFVAGLSPTQHPLLVFAFPAYVAFGLVLLWTRHSVPAAGSGGRTGRRPKLTGPQGLGRVLLRVVGCGLLGAGFYLYYPIRSLISAPPLPGPDDMHTWAGFLRVVTAQGLRGNLGGFALGQVLGRLWDVRVPLAMQFSLPGLLLAGLGWAGLWWPVRRTPAEGPGRRLPLWPVALLLTGYLACIVFVTVNVLQDAVAYLLGPMAVFAIMIGLGVDVALRGIERARRAGLSFLSPSVTVVAALALFVLPFRSLSVNWTRMDLSSFRDAEQWLAAVEERFVGQGQRAALLVEWERMTTVYYKQAVEGRAWDKEDLRFVPISAGTEAPFLHAAEVYLAEGPVYLTMYRPQVAARYRLAPVPLGRALDAAGPGWSGTLWQVLPGWPRQLPRADGVSPVSISAFSPEDVERTQPLIEIVGWRLAPDQGVSTSNRFGSPRSGDVLSLDLFMRLPAGGQAGTGAYYLPWVRLGETTYHFTTASRFNTPWWQPGEIVVERFELPVPWLTGDAREPVAGPLALRVGLREVSQGRELHLLAEGEPDEAGDLVSLASVAVALSPASPRLERDLGSALGNLRGEILLRGARIDGRRVLKEAVGGESRLLRPGQDLRVVLEWQSLRPIEDNYKVFVQLLDAGLQVRAQGDDKAPLAGSAPTLLWFPRWRAGTRITDRYSLDVPPDLPPGTYPLVVGMYGFSTFQRLPTMSYDWKSGEAVVQGDWITLAHLKVE
jgi:hypothetical protein